MTKTALLLAYFVIFGAIGMLIGVRKGRVVAGLIWAMLLGPIGWLIVLLGPNMTAPKAVPCPFCAGAVPINQSQCNHCKNNLRWLNTSCTVNHDRHKQSQRERDHVTMNGRIN